MSGSPQLRPAEEAALVVRAAPEIASALQAAGFRVGWLHGQEHPNGYVRELWWTHDDGAAFGTLAILPEGPVLAFDTLCRDGTVVTTSTPRAPLVPWALAGCWEKTVQDSSLAELIVGHRVRVRSHGGPAALHASRAIALGIEVRVEELILAADLPSARTWAAVFTGLFVVLASATAGGMGLDTRVAGGAGAVGVLVMLGGWFGGPGLVRRSAEEIISLGVSRANAEAHAGARAAAG